MPHTKEVPENTTEEKEITHDEVHTTNPSRASTPLLITIAVLLALILLGGAFAIGDGWSRPNHGHMFYDRSSMMSSDELGPRHMAGFLDTANRVSGVVTQVNGDHFTVASNGATKDVQTNSSTQYSGGSGVKVNDSVVVLGSTSNNQFTADQIVINP